MRRTRSMFTRRAARPRATSAKFAAVIGRPSTSTTWDEYGCTADASPPVSTVTVRPSDGIARSSAARSRAGSPGA